MVAMLILICITICSVAFAYAERQATTKRQEQIEKDLAELKVLIEAEAYKDKQIKDKQFLDVEV
jgi:hypothetical protein